MKYNEKELDEWRELLRDAGLLDESRRAATTAARLSPLPDNSLPDCAICHKIIDDRHLKTEVEMGDGAKRLAHETCYKIFNGIPNSTPDDSHYHKGRTDPWGYIIANELNFFEGNVVKYVTRWRHKNGLDDLRKARVYIDELIRQEEAKEKP